MRVVCLEPRVVCYSHQQTKATKPHLFSFSPRVSIAYAFDYCRKKNKLKTSRKRKNIFAPGRKIYRHRRRHHWRVGEDRPGKILGRTSTHLAVF